MGRSASTEECVCLAVYGVDEARIAAVDAALISFGVILSRLRPFLGLRWDQEGAFTFAGPLHRTQFLTRAGIVRRGRVPSIAPDVEIGGGGSSGLLLFMAINA